MTMTEAITGVGGNDLLLLVSLAYSASDIVYEWHHFESCAKPIHWWMIISYAFVVSFRVSHHVGNYHADNGNSSRNIEGDFLLNLRQQKTLPRLLVKLTWLMVLPLFAAWTITGTFWFRAVLAKTPECLPVGAHPMFIGFWLGLSYLWILVHCLFGFVAWWFERRLQNAEGNIRDVEDADSISRWGVMSEIPSYAEGPWDQNSGMTAKDIRQLPTEVWSSGAGAECSICLGDICDGDSVRPLPGCGHTFHKSCIDLWMLRRADCPLCKRQVTSVPNESCKSVPPSQSMRPAQGMLL